jgi:ABC-type transport system substrate-binding protein
MGHFDSPASMSLLEESTQAVNRPMSGVFNNLVMLDQHVPQNSLRSIVPDLATGWAWNKEGTEPTFPLRQGVNRHAPPFDNPDLRRAMSLSLDRRSFIDILTEGQGDIGGVMQPPPSGLWGMPPDLLKTLPGYNPSVQKSRAQARTLMEKLDYGPTSTSQ